jgi:hypothetical protein
MKSESSLQSGTTCTTVSSGGSRNNSKSSIDDGINSILDNSQTQNEHRPNDDDMETTDYIFESNKIPRITTIAATTTNILRMILDRMNPQTCLQPTADAISSCSGNLPGLSEPRPLDEIVPPLLLDLHCIKRRSRALHKLYRLTDRNRKYNRYVGSDDTILVVYKYSIGSSILLL